MRNLPEICIQRPVFATMLIMALVVIGVAALMNLGVDRFPSVDLPRVSVRTNLPGGTPEEVETEITERIEEVVNTVDGIDELRSITGAGSSIVIAEFKLERDIDSAAQDVRDRVATVLRNLPDDTDPPTISKYDNDSQPVLILSLSGDRTTRELTELADKILKRQLERSEGVGEVRIVGGLERTMNIWLDSDRLSSYKIPVAQIRDAIANQNANTSGGNVTGDQQEQVLRTVGRLPDQEAFDDLIIARLNGVPVRLRDLGHAEDGTAEQRSLSRLDGKPTVTLEIQRQSGANTVAVIEAVKANLERVRGQLPPDVQVQVIRDQSRYIYAALHEIDFHLIVGSILACMVVMLFVRNWRVTLITGIAIPTSLIGTFGVMWAMGFTLNGVTMLALVLMVGIVIDDAIVVLENIYRFMEEKKLSAFEAARQGTAEIALAVLATTLSLAVIFVPVSFMSSISGRFLYQFGITAAAAVMISLLVSFTLTPSMCARLLKPPKAEDGHAHDSRTGFYRFIDGGYMWLLRGAMRFRWVIALLAIATMLAAIPIYGLVQQEYLPSDVDEAEFEVSVTAPEGTSIRAMDDVMKQIEHDVTTTPGVTMTQSSFGGSFLGSPNTGSVYVRIEPHEKRLFSITRLIEDTLHGHPASSWTGTYHQRDVMLAIRKKLKRYLPTIRTRVRNFESFRIGGGNYDIDFVIRGPDLDKLAKYAETLRDESDQIGGITDADTTLKLDKPELRVHIDRDRAADMDIDARELGTALRVMIGGDNEVSRFRDPDADEDYDVRLRLSESYRRNPAILDCLYLTRPSGAPVQLSQIASIEEGRTPSRIDRLDRQRSNRLRAGIAPGFAQADRLEAVRQAADKLNMPSAYTYSISGKGRELERTFTQFLWAFLLSVIFMYMILAAQYESFIHPLTILLSLPLSVPFALLSIWATGSTLNLYSALGVLVLFGVVKKNAILQVDHMIQLEAAGMDRATAILEANRHRLRPILMTTLTLVAGMTPLLVGTGPGAEERYTIAVVIVGGQSLSLLLTLLVTPVAYSYFDDIQRVLKLKGRRSDAVVPATPDAPM
ncbi:MAG: MMPL family transporter [Planctomycetes bacterium]|nr:MMPL family transporter [Planctomycetota bacterium]